MFRKLIQLLRRPSCVHVFQSSRSRPGWVKCRQCGLYRRG